MQISGNTECRRCGDDRPLATNPYRHAQILFPKALPDRQLSVDCITMTTGEDRGGVLLSGLAMLECLGESGPQGVTQLANAIGIDKGNAHRIAKVLINQGFVDQDVATKHYRLAPRTIQLAGQALRQLDVRQAADDVLARLAAETGESTHLAVRTPDGGVYVAQVKAGNRLSVETEIGSSPIIHATATGKALYAGAEPGELELVAPEPLAKFTSTTITDRSVLDADLATVRSRGYAVDDEELNPDIRCAAAPVTGAGGKTVAAVGISGPVSRVDQQRLHDLGVRLRIAAAEISARLSWHQPA
ncbi:IclR family transcriptional regulator [Gordonia sp. DT219]|uniref:IclR family transcriptional regulator n=1 Tax=Gordonia sp. DT219 TaxID=3416658 RepID=UPI003CF7DB51